MSQRKGKVFLSYASQDLDVVRKLYNDLKIRGVNVWFDKVDLQPGVNWEHEINYQVKESSYFIAVISRHSVDKIGYVQKELKLGLEVLREFPESAIYLIPVRIDDTKPISEDLKKLHWADLFDDWHKGINDIMNVINPNYLKKVKPDKNSKIDISGKTIMYVDSDIGIHTLVKDIIEDTDFELISVYSGDEAVDMYKKHKPDLVVLDVNLKGINGIEVMRRIHDIDVNTPVIIYTAYKEYKNDFGTWASEDYVIKSSNVKELIHSIKRCLSKIEIDKLYS
jgi:CheY-like chemotaxis protein